MSKVSVIVPCYNAEKYIRHCLDGLIKQTHTDWEAILVNDGSTDNCGAILDEYAKLDDRFRVIHQLNQGTSVSRNNALQTATGEYIYFLDADDMLHSQMLEVCCNQAQKHNADMVCFGYYHQGRDVFIEPKINLAEVKSHFTVEPLYYTCKKMGAWRILFNVWSKFYKRELLEGIEFIKGIYNEDYPHTFAVLTKHPKTVILQEKLYYYSVNEASISHSVINPKLIRDYHVGLNYVYEQYNKPQTAKELEFIKHHLFPLILKNQLNKCKSAQGKNKDELLKELAHELQDLQSRGLLSWRGHNLARYWQYKRLLKNLT